MTLEMGLIAGLIATVFVLAVFVVSIKKTLAKMESDKIVADSFRESFRRQVDRSNRYTDEKFRALENYLEVDFHEPNSRMIAVPRNKDNK